MGWPRICPDMSDSQYTRSDSAAGQMAIGVYEMGGAHRCSYYHNVEYTTEPSMCDGNVALCQITLTTCYH